MVNKTEKQIEQEQMLVHVIENRDKFSRTDYHKRLDIVSEALENEKAYGVFANFFKNRKYTLDLIESEESVIDAYAEFKSHSMIYSDVLKLLFLSGGILTKEVLGKLVSTEQDIDRVISRMKVVKNKQRYISYDSENKMVILELRGLNVFKPNTDNRKINLSGNKINRAKLFSQYLLYRMKAAEQLHIRQYVKRISKEEGFNQMMFFLFKEEAYKNPSLYYESLNLSQEDILYIENKRKNASLRKKIFMNGFDNYNYDNCKLFNEFYTNKVQQIKAKNYEGLKEYFGITNTTLIKYLMARTSMFDFYKLYDIYHIGVQETFKNEFSYNLITNKEVEELNHQLKYLQGISKRISKELSKEDYKKIDIKRKKYRDQIREEISYTTPKKKGGVTVHNSTIWSLSKTGDIVESVKYDKVRRLWELRIAVLPFQNSHDKEKIALRLMRIINFYRTLFGSSLVEFHFNFYYLYETYLEREIKELIESKFSDGKNEFKTALENSKFISLANI